MSCLSRLAILSQTNVDLTPQQEVFWEIVEYCDLTDMQEIFNSLSMEISELEYFVK
jgi:hypothetical protein